MRRRNKLSVEPVSTPFPNIAGDGVETVAIGRKAVDRAGSGVTVFGCIFLWKFALPDVAPMRAARNKLVAPRIKLLLQTATRCKFPLRFGG